MLDEWTHEARYDGRSHMWIRPVEVLIRRVGQMEGNSIARGRERPRNVFIKITKKFVEASHDKVYLS